MEVYFLIILSLFIPNRSYPPLSEKTKELNDMQRWALGASGMLAERDHMRSDSLAGCEINKFTIKSWKNLLESAWDVNSRESLLENLEWLSTDGQSADFDTMAEMIKYIENNPGPTVFLQTYEEMIKSNEKYRAKAEIVAKYADFLGEKSLNGWDATRYICLCRWGFISGYLTEDEAWEKIMSAARYLQRTFDSWEDLGINYIIGREFWSPKNSERYLVNDAYMRLSEMPSSPWKELPWNLYLGEDTEEEEGTSGGMLAQNITYYP